MDKAQVSALIRQWRDTALEASEDEQISAKGTKWSDSDLDKADTALSVALEETHEALVSGAPQWRAKWMSCSRRTSCRHSIIHRKPTGGWRANCSRQRLKCSRRS